MCDCSLPVAVKRLERRLSSLDPASTWDHSLTVLTIAIIRIPELCAHVLFQSLKLHHIWHLVTLCLRADAALSAGGEQLPRRAIDSCMGGPVHECHEEAEAAQLLRRPKGDRASEAEAVRGHPGGLGGLDSPAVHTGLDEEVYSPGQARACGNTAGALADKRTRPTRCWFHCHRSVHAPGLPVGAGSPTDLDPRPDPGNHPSSVDCADAHVLVQAATDVAGLTAARSHSLDGRTLVIAVASVALGHVHSFAGWTLYLPLQRRCEH